MKKDITKAVLRRLKMIEGQVRGLEKMVEVGTYCIDIITQMSAARQALSSVEDAVLEHHLSTCVVDQMRSGSQAKAVREIMSVYKISKKNR